MRLERDLIEGRVQTSRVEERVVAVKLVGEGDLALVGELRAALEGALESDDAVIIDLSQATFVESSVLGELVRAHRTAVEQGNALVLQLGTEPIVERVVKLTRLDELIERSHTRKEALARIRERTSDRTTG